MLLSKTVKVKWTARNKNNFIKKGYIFNKLGEEVEIKTEDLTRYSEVKVEVKCDYCGEIIIKSYDKYMRGQIKSGKDSCKKCSHNKARETNMKNGYEYFINGVGSKPKHTIEECKELFKEVGYELLEDAYINNETHMRYLCPKHGEKEITLAHFLSGERCKECYYENNRGENNYMWNGGINEINNHLRGLLNDWRKESFKRYNYKCCITGINNNNLQIHHSYPFRNIVQDIFDELKLDIRSKVCDYSKDELNKIECLFLEKHKQKLGFPLTKELHAEFHSVYGTRASTEEDFYEFLKIKQDKYNKEINLDYFFLN